MSKKGFGEYHLSLSMREAIERIVVRVVNRIRPIYRYGRIKSWDRSANSAIITLDGSDIEVEINDQPFKMNRVVRVYGYGDDKYVEPTILMGGSTNPAELVGPSRFSCQATEPHRKMVNDLWAPTGALPDGVE